MLQDRIVTQSFMMPATLYLWQLVKAFLGKNWSWGIVLVSFFAVLGLFTDNAVYVAVILFFAAIPVAIFHFFVTKLTRPDARRLLKNQRAEVDSGGIVLRYDDGERHYYPWEYVNGCSEYRHYYLLRLDGGGVPFLYLPKEAFGDEAVCIAFEKMVVAFLVPPE